MSRLSEKALASRFGKKVMMRPAMMVIVAAIFGAGAPGSAQPVATPQDKGDRIILLGTKGGPVVDPERSEPASLLVIGGTPYLIDAGTGTAHRMVESGFPIAALKTVFITHHHLDHTAGLEPLLSLNWINVGLSGAATAPVAVYGPPATRYLVKAALDYLSVSERIFRAGINDLPKGEDRVVAYDKQPGAIYADNNVKVTAVENSHFGQASTGPDGQRDRSYSYRFDTPSGSVVFTGDTGPSEAVVKLAKGVDILVSEILPPREEAAVSPPGSAMRRQLAQHMTLEHLTPTEVGKMAEAAGVGKVVLTHIAGKLTPSSARKMMAEIAAVYHGPVVIGHDLQVIPMQKAGAQVRPH